MVFTFGSNGFFGYSSSAPTSSRSLMWWSTFETDTLPATKKIDTAAIKGALVRRHKHWNDPVVQDIVNKAEIQSIYPTWVLGELPNWGENGIVLVGDAAHAMDPTTGQGASQALEDSQTLALLLAECVKYGEQDDLQGREAVALALKLFYQIRNPRVQEIIERGRRIAGRKANVGIVAEYCMYFFLWLLNKFPSFGKYKPRVIRISTNGCLVREAYARGRESEAVRMVRRGGGPEGVQGVALVCLSPYFECSLRRARENSGYETEYAAQ